MLSQQQVYDLGRRAYLAGIGREFNPFKTGNRRAAELWDMGNLHEHNDEQDVVRALKQGASQ